MAVSSREGRFWGVTSAKSSFFGDNFFGGIFPTYHFGCFCVFYIHRENSGTLALSPPKEPFFSGDIPNKYQLFFRCIWG